MSVAQKPDVSLRRFEMPDMKRLAQLANNKKIWDCLRDRLPNPYTEEDAEVFISYCEQQVPPHTFAILYKGELVGSTGVVPMHDVNRHSAEIGYWIGEPFWNRGIATQALSQLVEYAFTTLKIHRLQAFVFDFNIASARVLEKCGFTREAVLREAVIKNNTLMDEWVYGLLNHEWKPLTGLPHERKI